MNELQVGDTLKRHTLFDSILSIDSDKVGVDLFLAWEDVETMRIKHIEGSKVVIEAISGYVYRWIPLHVAEAMREEYLTSG